MLKLVEKYAMVALSVLGGAILLYSCDGNALQDDPAGNDTLMTEYDENLSIISSENGRRSYHFSAPLLEGYTFAREPYREFRKGVKITTYQDDSLSTVDAILTANYAIHYTNRNLWEAKGNVVVEKSDGKRLYTQQLFWDMRTHRVYSNVDSRFVDGEGRNAMVGEGFEADDEFKFWRLRRPDGYMQVNVAPNEDSDSTAVAGNPAPEKPAAEKPSPEKPKPERSAAKKEAGVPREMPLEHRDVPPPYEKLHVERNL